MYAGRKGEQPPPLNRGFEVFKSTMQQQLSQSNMIHDKAHLGQMLDQEWGKMSREQK
jgi:hypothetical protein